MRTRFEKERKDPRRYYPWERFWIPRDGKVTLSPSGYLPDPNQKMGQRINPQVVPYEEISDFPCLALLGEPGMGKSYVIKDIIRDTEKSAQNTLVHFVDLKNTGSEIRACKKVVEAPEFRKWAHSDKDLLLILDSLDECMAHTPTVAIALADELSLYPLGHMRLRVACRTAEWPESLEEKLTEFWGQDNYGAYELVPLRRKDITTAAAEWNIDAGSFLSEVGNKAAEPLAIRPISLEFLLAEYEEDQELPPDQKDLYERG